MIRSSEVFSIYEAGSYVWPPKGDGERELRLWCDANDNWKTCSWRRQGIDGVCKLTYVLTTNDTKLIKEKDGKVWEVKLDGCGEKFGSPEFIDGRQHTHENSYCGLLIANPKLEHIGEWKCELERCNLEEDGGCITDPIDSPKIKEIVLVEEVRLFLFMKIS